MKISALIFVMAISLPAVARDLDEHATKALDQTQQLLRDKSQRDEAIKKDDNAKKADDYVKGLGTDTEGAYELSADIMADLVKQTGGDPVKLQELINKASRDPTAFGNSLSDTQKGKIQKLAEPIAPPVNHQ